MSATVRAAVLTPLLLGENETVIRQLLFAGKVLPLQPSLAIEKSAEFVPEIVATMPDSGALPVLVRVAMFKLVLEMGEVP